MKTFTHDVVIIGGGMSGLMASLYLAGKGFKIALISRGDPVCCLSTGCVDVLSPGTHQSDPLKWIDNLPENHPYRFVGKKGIEEAIKAFKEIMKSTKIPYAGSIRKNREILTPIGTFKTTCLVPVTMADAEGCRDGYTHVISFKGLKDFYPSYITSRLKNTGFSLYDAGVSSTLGIAARFEEKGFLEEFISWLEGLQIPPGKIAIPAVLGLNNPVSIMEELAARTGSDIFEIPTLPPSIPGLRLFRAMKGAVQERGGDLYWGKEISSVECSRTQVEAVTLSTSGRSSRVQGRAFILSTGSFVSGGLFARMDTLNEPVFNLPVFSPGERKDWFWHDFFTSGHPIEAAGIEADSSLRPKESDKDNLFVCGSILAHSEIMKLHCGHGLAISTGLKAAKMCERFLT